MTYIVRIPFKSKSGEIKKGQAVTMTDEQAGPLLSRGYISELGACPVCRARSWWLSVHKALVCGVCHPPVRGAVKVWIADAGKVGEAA